MENKVASFYVQCVHLTGFSTGVSVHYTQVANESRDDTDGCYCWYQRLYMTLTRSVASVG